MGIHHFDCLLILILQLTNEQSRLWLLLLDLNLRHFSNRDAKDREMEKQLYRECYLDGQLITFYLLCHNYLMNKLFAMLFYSFSQRVHSAE